MAKNLIRNIEKFVDSESTEKIKRKPKLKKKQENKHKKKEVWNECW